MCSPTLIAGLVLSGVGHFAQRSAARKAEKQRSAIFADDLARQEQADARMQAQVFEALPRYDAPTVQEAIDTQAARTGTQLEQQVLAGQSAIPDAGAKGRVSSAYATRAAEDRLAEREDIVEQAKRAARLDAPGDINAILGRQLNRTGEAVTGINDAAARQQGITQIRLAGVREKPSLLGELAGAAGGAMLSSGLGSVYAGAAGPAASTVKGSGWSMLRPGV